MVSKLEFLSACRVGFGSVFCSSLGVSETTVFAFLMLTFVVILGVFFHGVLSVSFCKAGFETVFCVVLEDSSFADV